MPARTSCVDSAAKIQSVCSNEGHSSVRPASVNIREARDRPFTVFAQSRFIDFDSTKTTRQND